MRRIILSIILSACCLMLPSLVTGQAYEEGTAKEVNTTPPIAEIAGQDEEGAGKEVYTGTIINMSGRSASIGFNLTLTGRTSDEKALEYLSVLASEGQDGLLKAISKNDLGYIAATGQTRRNLLVVREATIDGKRRIIAAFERWLGFYEVRGGYRSLDHPYSIIEIFFDEKGKGSGTFIGLAQVKLEKDKKTEKMRLELESFGSFPAKVMGVIRRNK